MNYLISVDKTTYDSFEGEKLKLPSYKLDALVKEGDKQAFTLEITDSDLSIEAELMHDSRIQALLFSKAYKLMVFNSVKKVYYEFGVLSDATIRDCLHKHKWDVCIPPDFPMPEPGPFFQEVFEEVKQHQKRGGFRGLSNLQISEEEKATLKAIYKKHSLGSGERYVPVSDFS